MMIAAPSFTSTVARWMGFGRESDMDAGEGRTCAVTLIDRRTGDAHRINGKPLVLFTRRPQEAAAELLQGRDPQLWDIRITPLAGDRQ
ncbi:hypothetical protein ACFP8Z_00760 [Gemmobacter lanyuensis]|nr:hypothetical protein [Gemmobacter lanyuensis]